MPERTTRRLVIVESPAKAKTIQGYLGDGFEVTASVGHIRDLPDRAADIPAKYKGEPWARLGVDIENNFNPIYVVNADKRARVKELKDKMAGVDELLLATDEDREGEAIAWHLLEVLKPKIPVRRMVFNEITRDAIQGALQNTRELDKDLVDAQETRRILDRLYGYEVSPVLWKKVMPRLSAGRVQSVALRLVVDRERERMAFVRAEYADIEALVDPGSFTATLTHVDGKRIARGDSFNDRGELKKTDVRHLELATAQGIVEGLTDSTMTVDSVEEKPGTRRPSPPFMTSTLQQEASRKLRWGGQRTMRVAQGLYERGYITYMRTDSTTLSATAINAARAQAAALYGEDHLFPGPKRTYDRKVKNAQEAHEAIRPAGDSFRTPGQVSRELNPDELALYDLIWKRTVASQMADARVATTSLRLAATTSDGVATIFSASGTVVTFPGFLAAYEESRDDDDSGEQRRLPRLAVGDEVNVRALNAELHATKPPARYTEASLLKALEERGIGRPSTWSNIIGTLLDRGYVFKRGSALVPAWLAFAVVRLLEDHFSSLVDYDFTAELEEILDTVASGDQSRNLVLGTFYYGGADPRGGTFVGLHPMIERLPEIDPRENSTFPIDGEVALRVGKFGPYLEQGEKRANVPADLPPDELTAEKAIELLNAPKEERVLGKDPDTGHEIVTKSGRFGPYVTEVLPPLPEGAKKPRKTVKPRTASLFSDMEMTTITLEEALRLLSLPREVGKHPEDGEPIMAQNGRYGPYLTHGKDSRSLPDEPSIFTCTVDEALALFAQPKRGRGRQEPQPGKEIGTDPISGKKIELKEGRFGPYVTDGETNASLRVADDPLTITLERASDLISERRAKGPAPKKPRKKAAAKK
ncbi:MAG: type I DNA topoisomerase [Candidatus Nanopelagicales bacterium]|nr:type I DNA topoisomerase [Candidatus Nanopelagicales bacterium]